MGSGRWAYMSDFIFRLNKKNYFNKKKDSCDRKGGGRRTRAREISHSLTKKRLQLHSSLHLMPPPLPPPPFPHSYPPVCLCCLLSRLSARILLQNTHRRRARWSPWRTSLCVVYGITWCHLANERASVRVPAFVCVLVCE